MIYLLDGTGPDTPFPDVEQAETYPNGLLAMGGDLSPQRLVNAYKCGIFPWYSVYEPILWWSPDPRLVLFPQQLHISRSLRKTLKRATMIATTDQAFSRVIHACADTRYKGSWLITDMIQAYERLHELSIAHSIEVWEENNLVGGLYGVALGQIFFGESMFSLRDDASKIALVHLVQTWDCKLIDCQVRTEHLISMGAEEIPRPEFCQLLNQYV